MSGACQTGEAKLLPDDVLQVRYRKVGNVIRSAIKAHSRGEQWLLKAGVCICSAHQTEMCRKCCSSWTTSTTLAGPSLSAESGEPVLRSTQHQLGMPTELASYVEDTLSAGTLSCKLAWRLNHWLEVWIFQRATTMHCM